MTMSTVSSSLRTMTPPMSHVFENGVGYGRTCGDVGKDQLEEQQQLRGADERDEQDDAWRGEEPAHDEQLERGAEHRADRDAGRRTRARTGRPSR